MKRNPWSDIIFKRNECTISSRSMSVLQWLAILEKRRHLIYSLPKDCFLWLKSIYQLMSTMRLGFAYNWKAGFLFLQWSKLKKISFSVLCMNLSFPSSIVLVFQTGRLHDDILKNKEEYIIIVVINGSKTPLLFIVADDYSPKLFLLPSLRDYRLWFFLKWNTLT